MAKAQIRLSKSNHAEIRQIQKMLPLPTSLNTFVNFILERHGIPQFKQSDLFHDSVKPVKKCT